MTDSQLIYTPHRNALAVRDMLTRMPLAAIALLALVLTVALVAATGSSPAFAEGEQQVAAAEMPAAVPVNINSADAAMLAKTLRGVGETRALEIVRHRETYGPFASAEELMEVKGIGQSTLDRNRDLITLE